MKTRARSAFIMAPLLIIVFLGGYYLMAGVFVLSWLAINEFCAAFGERRPARWAIRASLIVLYSVYLYSVFTNALYLRPFFTDPLWTIPFWIFISILLGFISMFAMEKRDLLQGMATFVGMFYINFLAFHLIMVDAGSFGDSWGFQTRGLFSGIYSFVWIVVLAAFGTDIFAYFTGKLLGRHKLCPSISPGKTVEGAVGGVVGSVVLCGLFGWFLLPHDFILCVIIGVAGGVVSQLGDLSASVMKRKIGIKDWGTMIPGHGGVLDRIDSLLFTAPLAYYILYVGTKLFWVSDIVW